VSPQKGELGTSRVISSIPRSSLPHSAAANACPVNHEQETGADAKSGNWIYPSEKMFFDAMRRKGKAGGSREEDMQTVVPMHNAVNERAWKEIRKWEAPYIEGSTGCDGPRLHSFSGQSTKLSPKARINTLLGYAAPFDRHDWVVDRCGKQVEYIIDFYSGKPDTALGQAPGQVSFFLDVRPKINSLEGLRMRSARWLGIA
jgi:cytochrome c heme-lyase